MLDDRTYCLALEPSELKCWTRPQSVRERSWRTCRGAIWSSPSVEVFVLRVSCAVEIGEDPGAYIACEVNIVIDDYIFCC